MLGHMLVRLTEHLLQKKEEENNFLLIHVDRCVRTRHQKASCQKCAEVCPQNAISFQPTPQIDLSRCIDCGLCQLSCPTEAITWKKFSVDKKNRLLQKSLEETQIHQKPLKLMCERTPKAYWEKGTVLPCLGHLQSHDLAYLIENAPTDVELIISDCTHCPHQVFAKNLETIVQTISQQISRSIPSEQKLIFISTFPTPALQSHSVQQSTPSGSDPPEDVMDRRAFFKKMGLQTRQVLKEVAMEETRSLFQDVGLNGSDQDAKTHTALTKIAPPSLQPKRVSPHDFEWTVKDTCLHCHVCMLVCPVDAIDHQENKLQFYMSRCLDCGLCQDVCFRGALTRTPVFSRSNTYYIQ